MRHRKKTIKLNRDSAHRRALLTNLAISLVREETITTTLVKAKAVQPLADRLVTLGKKGTLAARRRALQLLGNREAVKKLFSEIAPRFEERPGGYTRILKLAAPRTGDGATLALLAYVELSGEKKSLSSKEKKKTSSKEKKKSSPKEKKKSPPKEKKAPPPDPDK